MVVAKLLKAASTCRLVGVSAEQFLIQTIPKHFAFGLEPIGIDDAHPQSCCIEHLLKKRENNRMCRSRAQTSDPAASQRRVEGDEAVLANVQRHLTTSVVPSQRGGHENTVRQEDN